MGYTADRISRLETRRTALEAALAALSGGVEEYWIGPVRYRRVQLAQIQAALGQVEADLSMLNALADQGARSYLRREPLC